MRPSAGPRGTTVAVFSVPDETCGESPCAVVVLRAGLTTAVEDDRAPGTHRLSSRYAPPDSGLGQPAL
jgi:acyl-CoA synthetase (AMP-forming)/AMP-acid ligase II